MRPAGMRHALHAEWTKLRTAPGTAWLVLAVIALTVAMTAATAAAVRCPAGACAVDSARTSLSGVELGQAVVAILAVLAIGGEYSTGMIRITLTAMPRRTTVLAAKAAVLSGIVLVAGTISVLGSLLAGWLILPGPVSSPGEGPVLRAIVGSILYLTLIALLSLGTAITVRDPAAAIGIVLGLLYLFPIITHTVSDPDWQRHLEQIGPMSAGLTVQATTDLGGLPIGPWTGLGVLAAWAAAALAAAGLLLHRRDA